MKPSKQEQQSRLLLFAGLGKLTTIETEALIRPMIDMGLIGSGINGSAKDYLPGDRFIDHISFLGCSPHVALTPEEGEHYCYVRFPSVTTNLVLHFGTNTQPPRCRQCNQLIQDWKNCTQADFCGQCTLEERHGNLTWRRRGVLSRWVIEIMNIHPHEAVPSPMLLTSLAGITGVEWYYAYLMC